MRLIKKIVSAMRYLSIYAQIVIWFTSFADKIFAENIISSDVLVKKVKAGGFGGF